MPAHENEVFAQELCRIHKRKNVGISIEQARSIARQTRDRMKLLESHKQPIRPAEVSKALNRVAKNLNAASQDIERLGRAYVLHVFAAAGFPPDGDDKDIVEYLSLLSDLAEWTSAAAATAASLPETKADQRGGRSADVPFHRAVFALAGIYAATLRVAPTHVIDPGTGLRSSCFDEFVFAAVKMFVSRDNRPGSRATDVAIARAVRDWNNSKPRSRRRSPPQ